MTTSTLTRTLVHPGRVKEALTAAVAKVSGEKRGTVLAAELEKLGYDVDAAEGMRSIHFIERHCRGTKAPYYGKLVKLRPWQFVIIFTFFACLDEHGHRLFRKLWLEVGKKNGKTAMIAWLLLYCLSYVSGHGAEVFAAASAAKQAAKIYKPMASIVAQDPALRKMIRPFRGKYMLHNERLDSTFEVMSADADFNDGAIVAACGVDEVHRHKSDGMYQVLVQGQGTTEDPCFFAITTAGYGREGLAWNEHVHAEHVISGTVEDKHQLCFVYSVPEEADWTDSKVWPLANPALGDFLRWDDMESAIAKAVSTPTEEHSVRRLRLNQWVASETKWLDLLAWEKCGGLVDEVALKGRDFFGGLDISHSRDFTAWNMFFPDDDQDGSLAGRAVWRFWMPEAALVTHRAMMRPEIEAWHKAGLITFCTGDTIDLREVRDQILEDCRTFSVREIGYDRFHSHGIINDLMEELGPNVLADVSQGFSGMNAPAKELERMVSRRALNHGGNAVMKWMASNAVADVDRDDRIRPSRLRSSDKLDGIMALCMSLNRAITANEANEFTFYIPDEEVSG